MGPITPSEPSEPSEPSTAPAPRTPSAWTVRASPIGPLLLVATAEGLVLVGFHADDRVIRRALGRLSAHFRAEPTALPRPPAGAEEVPGGAVLELAARELDDYFRGELRSFTVRLDWSLSTGFNQRVLRELAASVRYSAVVGYQDLAKRVGEPDAARAVGAAMGSNPLPIVVPCHRVVAADGGIGGFGGGLETKRTLLALEGVLPAPMF
jgi:methylated-DNA-[protein]-cysteine S-methyltransferase